MAYSYPPQNFENMIDFSASLPAFLKIYDSEEACVQAIFEARWPKGFVCPNCSHNDGYRLSKPRTMQCASCRKQISITAETLFQDARVPLKTWFLALYLIANDKGGVSGVRLAKQLGVSRNTANLMLKKIRFAMGNRDENLMLAGYIELDEAFFGGRAPNKRAGKSPFDGKTRVLVMVESENMQAGNLVMKVIEDDNIDTLKEAVGARVEADPPGQYFRTDALGRHHAVRILGHHLNMSVMSKAELDSQMACLSLAISHAKRFFKGTYHHFCKRYIQNYLNEFCYRWNRRHVEQTITAHLISACVLHSAATAKAVTLPRLA